MPRYAKDQPVGFRNAIERVAIVGAGGTIGSHIAAALVQTGHHTVTALTRQESINKLAEGVRAVPVDYNDETTLIAALKDQQFLIITMAPNAPEGTETKIIHAASRAGIPYIMPNGYAGDIENKSLGEDTLLGPIAQGIRDEIETLGMRWITICCGFWYEYSLAGGEARFGFDFENKSMTMYDEGDVKVCTSTLAQVGRVVAKLLSLKELPQDENDTSLTLSTLLNKGVCVQSFVVSQRHIFESVKRVTGTTDVDWVVTRESARQRYEEGLKLVKGGNMAGFGKLLYARAFYADDPNDFEDKAQNEIFGLPEESLDEATRVGIGMVQDLQRRVERMAS